MVYDIAITVAACLNAGTRADVAWLVGADGPSVPDWSDAVVFTPGGGKTGSILGGALDGKLGDIAGRLGSGRLVELELTQVDALIADLPSGGSVRCLMVPADSLPHRVWELAAARERFCVVSDLSGDEVVAMAVFSHDNLAEADIEVQELFGGPSASTQTGERLVSVFIAVPQMVVVGDGPVAEALVELARWVGWQARAASEPGVVSGLTAQLSGRDMVVVAAHDLELAGAALASALASGCGYIGSVGSKKMQADRSDWLAYRGITDLTRVRGPAGLDIGAATPQEIAVSIVAQAISERRLP